MSTRADLSLSRVEAQNKWAYELAMIASPAVKIEPAVLRALRLEFLAASDPSAEADLWMSPLVQVRSASAITLVPEVASRLRSRLFDEGRGKERFEKIADRIAELHAGLPALLQLEERLIRLGVESPDPAAAIDAELGPLLRTMRDQPDKAAALTSWAIRALPRLPESAHRSNALWSLAIAGSAHFGVQPLLTGDPPPDALRLVPGLLPSDMPTVNVEVRRNVLALELYLPVQSGTTPPSSSVEGGVLLQVAATRPVIVEVRETWRNLGNPDFTAQTTVALSPGDRKHIRSGNGTIQLRTLRGDLYNLLWHQPPDTTQSAEEPIPRAEEPNPPPPVEPEEEEDEEIGGDEEEDEKPEPYRVYLSYASEDQSLAQELRKHLAVMIRQGIIAIEGPPQIGSVAVASREEQMRRTDLFLLLVSAAYLANEETFEEAMYATKLGEQGLATVVPIQLRPASTEGTPFSHLQGLPRSREPVTSAQDRDSVWTEIASEIRALVQRETPPAPTPPRRKPARKKPPRPQAK